MEERNERLTKIGTVVSDKMNKTIVVSVGTTSQNPIYKKYERKTKTYKVHDENNECKVGDTVEIEETRPLSKTVHNRLVKIIERAK